jgi:hypothetical protein
VTNSKMGTSAARVVALITAGALAAGAGFASTPAGASPHARAATEVRTDAAPALTSSNLDLALNTWYTCVGPCASATYYSDYGVARSGFTIFGYSGAGVVGSALKNGCTAASEHLALTEQAGPQIGDAIYFSSTFPFCPTKNPNVSTEHALFAITGGTGAFKGATGKGSFTVKFLTNPQVGFGTLTASITY